MSVKDSSLFLPVIDMIAIRAAKFLIDFCFVIITRSDSLSIKISYVSELPSYFIGVLKSQNIVHFSTVSIVAKSNFLFQ